MSVSRLRIKSRGLQTSQLYQRRVRHEDIQYVGYRNEFLLGRNHILHKPECMGDHTVALMWDCKPVRVYVVMPMGDKLEALSRGGYAVYEAIVQYLLDFGYPPSVREICDMVGYKSTATVHHYMQELNQKGVIVSDEKSPRAIRVIGYKFVKED